MFKMMAGLLVGVFAGALVYEVVRKTEFVRKATRKVSEGVQASKMAFDEGFHRSRAEGESSPKLSTV